MKPTQTTLVLMILDVIYFTDSLSARDYDYDCGESANAELYGCLDALDAVANDIDPHYFTADDIKKFCRAVTKADECVHAAIEECSNEIYDDPDYKYFSESLKKAKSQCSDQGNTINQVRRHIFRRR